MKHHGKKKKTGHKKQQPTIAVSMEMDELDEKATPAEIKRGESTRVTKLVKDDVD